MMRTQRRNGDVDELTPLDQSVTEVLDTQEERAILTEMAECRRALQHALERIPNAQLPDPADGPLDLAQYVAATTADANPEVGARLGAVARRYTTLRGKLALANMRLVAHVAKPFRDRGIAHADLIQEGFCGLLEAIDRFDLAHGTKLATYATWWIRQAMQRAVAGGAYPVRLSPRHLRQLAQSQDEIERAGGHPAPDANASELVHRIHAATRPTLSLDASLDTNGQFSLLQTMSDPEGDQTDAVDTGETIGRLMEALRPREQEVLALRFGLGGRPKLSLSQVGLELKVSKERVRQIQDRALQKLRGAAESLGLVPELVGA